jgi:hypothetical protein
MTLKEFYMKRNTYSDSKYVMIHDKKVNLENFKIEHANFCMNADMLKSKSNGKLNMYKTGSVKCTADYLLYKLTKNMNFGIQTCEQDESEWIEDCYNGGVIKMIGKGEYKTLHKLDYCSKYPAIMYTNNTFPVKRGSFGFVTTEVQNKEFLPKGIYRCKITGTSDIFVFNPKNKYVSHEIYKARKIFNLNVEFIDDGKPNMLVYSNDKCIKMKTLFGSFIDEVFPLKQQGLEFAKGILTVPWGSVCQKNKLKTTKRFRDSDDKIEVQLSETEYINSVQTISNDRVIVNVKDVNRLYVGDFPRLLSFLTCFGRCDMYDLLHDKMHAVKTVLTDGFLVDDLSLFLYCKKQGASLGALVYEGYYKNITLGKVNTSQKQTEFVPFQ